MKKRFLVAFATILGILGLGASDSYATAGNSATISGGSWNICVSTGSGVSYDGSSFVADIVGVDISTQLLYGDFTTESCKTINLTTGNNYTVTMNKPMGVTSMSYTTASNKLTFSATPVNKYLNIFGSQEQVIAASKVNISFNANGGAGTMSAMTNQNLTNVVLTSNSFTKTDYRFDGWNTKADGTGTSYADGDTVSFATGGEVELFAQWAPDVATLDTGTRVNVKIKKLAGANNPRDYTPDENIKAIKKSSYLPDGFNVDDDNRIISSPSSFLKIYAWFDDTDRDEDGEGDGVLYVYSDAGTIRGGSDMSKMFATIKNLDNISALNEWDVSRTTNMDDLFRYYNDKSNLRDLTPLAEWDVSSVTSMSRMFYNSPVENIEALEKWNTVSLKDISNMFTGTEIKVVDALATTQRNGYKSWDVSSVENMKELFTANALEDIDALATWDVSNVKSMRGLFSNARALSDISALRDWDVSSVTSMYGMFEMGSSSSSLVNISALTDWNTSNVEDMGYMFLNNVSITDISALATWDVSNVKSVSGMFDGLGNVTDISPLAGWNTVSLEDMSSAFLYMTSVSDISPLADWDTSNVKSMTMTFYGMRSLSNISPLAGWNTSNVGSMDYMFFQTSISNVNDLATTQRDDYISWDVSKVTTMNRMFYNCVSLTNISALASWNTARVENLDYMFASVYYITDISALASWDVSSVTSMQGMFDNDTRITDLSALENWTVASTVNITNIFNGIPASVTRPYWYHE